MLAAGTHYWHQMHPEVSAVVPDPVLLFVVPFQTLSPAPVATRREVQDS